MKDQEQFMMNLLDFSNFPSKRTQYDSNKGSQVKKTSKIQIIDSYNNAENQLINPTDSSQRLLQSFNGLREKLQIMTRQNLGLKEQIQAKNKQILEVGQKQTYLKSLINERNKKVSSLEQQIMQYKRRLQALKQSSEQIQFQSCQLQGLKMKLSSIFKQNLRLKQQLHRNMQISLNEKINLEQKLQYLNIKDIQTDKGIEQVQNKLYEKNKDFIRLQNQYKKLKIVYDEEMFSKNFRGKEDILTKENMEMRIKLEDVENKYRKEKNKKYELERKLLELEEKLRLYGTKTDVYQCQLMTISKKMKKVQKNQTQAKKQANAALQQKLTWEQKFYNSLIIGQELISRVKRQLIGDVVELAKASEFRLNKLKNDQKIDLVRKIDRKRNKSSSVKKLRSQTISNPNKIQQHHKEQISIMHNFSEKQTKNVHNDYHDNDHYSKTVLKQLNPCLINNELNDVKRNLFNNMNTPTKPQNNLKQIQVESLNLQAKIRKERELMQRKLREKILYNKIEDSTNKITKDKLRDHFLTLAAINI